MLDALAEFDLKLRYLRRRYNLVADALSRMHASTTKSLYTGEDGDDRKKGAAEGANVSAVRVYVLSVGQVQVDSAAVKALREDYTKDSIYFTVYEDPGEQFTKSADGLLYDAERRLCVPIWRLRMVLMHDAHDAIVKGNLGFEKCYQDLSRNFTWPSMRRDPKEYVCSCDSCQRNKPRNQLPIGLLNPLEVPTRLDQVNLGFVMEFPRTLSGHDAILVVVDRLSKIVRFCPATSDVDAVGSAKLFFNHCIGTMVSRARLCRTVTGVLLASFGKS
jgi:Integrase zinc binding domain